jgi:hypothetical protein
MPNDCNHPVATLDKRWDQVLADEARGARDK